MLKVKDLTFSYGSGVSARPVFEHLSLEFSPGLNVVLGPNGAGKSTLLKSMFGLLKYKGVIYCGEENVTTMKTDDKTKLMSYLPQMDIDSSMLTVLEMVLLGRLPGLGQRVTDEDLQSVMDTLDALNIAPLASRSFGELSGGQKKLVFIAQTLVRDPKIILLDEPVNSLDLQKQLELCDLLKRIVEKKDISVIVVLHDINLAARFAHRLIVIDENGSFYSAGTPREVITETMLREVYGVVASLNYDEYGTPTISPIRSVRDNQQ
jgi:iron complex transport system ATP-binding protein